MDLLSDHWYVRLPDGTVVRAKTTSALRYNIETGRIPVNCRVRRNPDEDWVRLDFLAEFEDLFSGAGKRQPSIPPPPTRGELPERDGQESLSRSGMEFRTIGVRGLVNELFNAADSSLNSYKLWMAGLTALIWAVSLLGWRLFHTASALPWSLVTPSIVILVMAISAGLANTLIIQMTFFELSTLRKPSWHEIRPSFFRNARRITSAQFLILGTLVAILIASGQTESIWNQLMPEYVYPELLAGVALSINLLTNILIWPVTAFSFLLGPLIVVEECSLGAALTQWWELLRRDLSRIFLYETLATALGAVLTAPLIFPVLWVWWTMPASMPSFVDAVSVSALHVLGGLALTPLVAYLLTANTFIYLNLRYEFFYSSSR